ncbi:MAG TPA: hypothetical protein VES66_09355 [Terriglobales bacterium]|nr:hypothetical protein [Terriglobales bacterium]
MTSTRNYARIVGVILALWLAASITASALGVFASESKHSFHAPLPLGLAVLIPLAVFFAWLAVSREFRQFALAVDVRTLTTIQAWRLGGFVFLVLYAHGILPGAFALPAGWGDMVIGATAPLAARYLTRESGRRTGFIAWQVLGVLDLVMAVSLGVLNSAPVRMFGQGVTTEAMSTLPLSVIPTFAVPLLMIFHLISIAQAWRWEAGAASVTEHGSPVAASCRRTWGAASTSWRRWPAVARKRFVPPGTPV